MVQEHTGLATSLKNEMDAIYQELITSENLIAQPLIAIGTEFENPITLNRNDASGQRGIWDQEEIYGKWEVKVKKGVYNIKFKFIKPIDADGRMFLETGAVVNQMKNDSKTDVIEMKNVKLPEMEGSLVPFYMINRKRIFPFWVEMERID